MPVIRVIKKSSSRNILAQSRNHTFRKCKQFNIRNTKKRKMSRKYKILYGGEQHINTISNEMKKRMAASRKKLLQLGQFTQAPPQVLTQKPVASTLSSSNIITKLKNVLMQKFLIQK